MHNVALVYCIKNLISKILFILKISPNKFSPFSPSITILWSAKKKKKKEEEENMELVAGWHLLFMWDRMWDRCLSKSVRGIFHFRFLLVFMKVLFLFNKMHGLFDFKTS